MNLQLFRKLRIDHEKVVGKKATGRIIDGMHMVMVNTTFTQESLDNTMVRRTAGDPKSLILPDVMIDDQDFFDQLLNERFNPEKGTWDRIDETTIPVDFRDCVRYARAAAEVYVNGNWSRIPSQRPKTIVTAGDLQKRQQKSATQKSKQQEPEQRFVRRPRQTKGFIRRRSR